MAIGCRRYRMKCTDTGLTVNGIVSLVNGMGARHWSKLIGVYVSSSSSLCDVTDSNYNWRHEVSKYLVQSSRSHRKILKIGGVITEEPIEIVQYHGIRPKTPSNPHDSKMFTVTGPNYDWRRGVSENPIYWNRSHREFLKIGRVFTESLFEIYQYHGKLIEKCARSWGAFTLYQRITAFGRRLHTHIMYSIRAILTCLSPCTDTSCAAKHSISR